MRNANLFKWLESHMIQPPKREVKENKCVDLLAIRYDRILRLRELARAEAAKNVRDGQPYNLYKLRQADHLLRQITDRLNSRPIFNQFNFN